MKVNENISPAAKRKRRQRQREKDAGIHEVRVNLTATEHDRLLEICRVRAGCGKPYDSSELVALLIDRDWKKLQEQLAELGEKRCAKCKESLPKGCDGLFKGDSACFHTSPNWKELRL